MTTSNIKYIYYNLQNMIVVDIINTFSKTILSEILYQFYIYVWRGLSYYIEEKVMSHINTIIKLHSNSICARGTRKERLSWQA